MTLYRRILDMLPVMLVFALVSVFAMYMAVAFIANDALWLETLTQIRADDPPARR